MTEYPAIPGSRVIGEPTKPEKEFSLDYLRLKGPQAKALRALHSKVREVTVRHEVDSLEPSVPCVGRADEFSGDELLSEREAELACARCPAFKECAFYLEVARPMWGVYAGAVRGG